MSSLLHSFIRVEGVQLSLLDLVLCQIGFKLLHIIGVVINATYAILLLKEVFEPGFDNSVREILISAIALEFGWAVILVWAMLKPLERRYLLLITALPLE